MHAATCNPTSYLYFPSVRVTRVDPPSTNLTVCRFCTLLNDTTTPLWMGAVFVHAHDHEKHPHNDHEKHPAQSHTVAILHPPHQSQPFCPSHAGAWVLHPASHDMKVLCEGVEPYSNVALDDVQTIMYLRYT